MSTDNRLKLLGHWQRLRLQTWPSAVTTIAQVRSAFGSLRDKWHGAFHWSEGFTFGRFHTLCAFLLLVHGSLSTHVPTLPTEVVRLPGGWGWGICTLSTWTSHKRLANGNADEIDRVLDDPSINHERPFNDRCSIELAADYATVGICRWT